MNTNYVAPQIEVIELEIEDAVLAAVSGTENMAKGTNTILW